MNTQRYLVYYNVRQGKPTTSYIWEPGTIELEFTQIFGHDRWIQLKIITLKTAMQMYSVQSEIKNLTQKSVWNSDPRNILCNAY